MDLSIILVNWNGKALLEQCLHSLEASGTRCSYEVIISDNGSTDGSQEWLRDLSARTPYIHYILNQDNPGFGVGNNRAIPYCRGRYVLFLNTDTIIQEPLDELIAAADAMGHACGVIGGRVLNADGSIQLSCRNPYTLRTLIESYTFAFAGVRTRSVRQQDLESWDHNSVRDVAMVSGCYMLMPRHVIDQVGGFDPNIFLFFEDTDLCYRVRAAGYAVRYVPASTIIHLDGGASRKSGLNSTVLASSVWSARYFAKKYLGRGKARILATEVWFVWLLMRGAMTPVSLLAPQARQREIARRRIALLRHMLKVLPRQTFPPTVKPISGSAAR